MKILILVIFSHSDIYNEMYLIQKSYLNNNANFDSYFVTLNESINEDIVLNDDIIYIKGKESYTNILLKTMKALEYINNKKKIKYDFVVRTNISTIIHLKNLYEYLCCIPKTKIYTGGNIETLMWALQPYEICETKYNNRNDYYGTKYITGHSIVLSCDVIEKLLNIKDNIIYDIVDDVKLGLIIKDNFPDIYHNITNIIQPKIIYNNYREDIVFVRNKTLNRKMDIHQIRNIALKFNNVVYPDFEKKIYITNKKITNNLNIIKKEWEKLNPEYIVELYDDKRCLEFLNEYFGNKLCDIFNYIKDGPIKADFFRVCLLYIYGGVYVDADIKPISPLKNYVDDDVEFMTCISYNYSSNKKSFCFNPHFIVTKKFSPILLEIIYSYIKLYEEMKYDYWYWSICRVFQNNFNLIFSTNIDNSFIIDKKKYKFLIENIIDNDTHELYDFNNYRKNEKYLFTCNNLNFYCSYNNNIVFFNFLNKSLIKNT